MTNEEIKAQAEEIFNAVQPGAENLGVARSMVAMFYVPDRSYHRAAISQALHRLELHFNQQQVFK